MLPFTLKQPCCPEDTKVKGLRELVTKLKQKGIKTADQRHYDIRKRFYIDPGFAKGSVDVCGDTLTAK